MMSLLVWMPGPLFLLGGLCPGGGLCMMSLLVWMPGPLFLLGGICPGGCLSERVSPWSHVPSLGVSV